MSASSEKKRRQAERAQGIDKKAEALREAEEKAKKSKLKWRIGTGLIVVFVALCILLNTGLPYKMTAVKVGGESLSAAEMNYYYSTAYYNYYSYLSMFGVDTTQPLKNQPCSLLEDGGSWYDFLMQDAMESARYMEAMYAQAQAEGFEMSEDAQAAVEDAMAELPEYAESYGYDNVADYLVALYGTGVTENLVREIITKGNLVSEYVAQKGETFTFTDAELKAYYEEHKAELMTYDYAYFYIAAETESVTDADGKTTNEVVEGGVDAALADAKAIAAKAVDVASFETAVVEYKEGSTVQSVTGNAASSINSVYGDWITATTREPGDVTAISSETGAYVVMYLGTNDQKYPSAAMRHILIQTQDTDEDGELDASEQINAKIAVEAIEAEWQKGEQNAETFAALAEKYSQDGGSNTNGGLYEDIGKGDMVEEINDFLFAEGRKEGDTVIAHGNNGNYDGYHLVYFEGYGRDYYLSLAEFAMSDAAFTEWEAEVLEQYPISNGMFFNLIGK